MPHQCTDCRRVFADGSKQMLAGCPDCGGNKFQFRPKGTVSVSEESPPTSDAPQQSRTPKTSQKTKSPQKTRTTTLREWARKVTPGSSAADGGTSSATSTTQRTASTTESPSQPSGNGETSTATTSLDSFADDSDDNSGDESEADESPRPEDLSTERDHEDAAQADARSGFVEDEELPESSPPDGEDHPEDFEPRPDLAELREELNDQFESIKVVEPGQYELNLMELYDREEYIIALQENGRYVIEVPDAWDSTE